MTLLRKIVSQSVLITLFAAFGFVLSSPIVHAQLPAASPTTGQTTTPTAANGRCQFACTPQVIHTCSHDSDCTSFCNTQCPIEVQGATCATTPPPTCANISNGAGTCSFDCTPPAQSMSSCQVGSNTQCTHTCSAVCATPGTGSSGSSPAQCSNRLAVTCAAPAAAGSPAAGSTGGAVASIALTNPITGANTIPDVAGKLIKLFVGFVGSLALLMFVWGGIRWILSAGDSHDVAEAKNILKNATIGLLIIFLSYGTISVGLGFISDIGGGSTTPSTSTSATPASTNPTTGASTSASLTSAQCNHTYPPPTSMASTVPDCPSCRSNCMNEVCIANASDHPTTPSTNASDIGYSFADPTGISAATQMCATRCSGIVGASCPVPTSS